MAYLYDANNNEFANAINSTKAITVASMVHVLFCFVFRVFRKLLCENESKMLKIAHQEILKSF